MSTSGIHETTRNAFESDALLKTYRVVLRALLKGEQPRISHTGHPTRQLFVIEVLLNVVAFEAYINGMSHHFGIQLPAKMWAKGKNKNGSRYKVPASLEFRTNEFLKKARVRFRRLKLTNQVMGEFSREINAAHKVIKGAIKLRNKVAHGQTLFVMDGASQNSKQSKFLRQLTLTDVKAQAEAFAKFRRFCDLMFEVGTSSSSHHTAKVFLFSYFKRNDLLAPMGLKSLGGITTDIRIAETIEADEALNPPRPFTDAEKQALLDRISRNDYPKKKKKPT